MGPDRCGFMGEFMEFLSCPPRLYCNHFGQPGNCKYKRKGMEKKHLSEGWRDKFQGPGHGSKRSDEMEFCRSGENRSMGLEWRRKYDAQFAFQVSGDL